MNKMREILADKRGWKTGGIISLVLALIVFTVAGLSQTSAFCSVDISIYNSTSDSTAANGTIVCAGGTGAGTYTHSSVSTFFSVIGGLSDNCAVACTNITVRANNTSNLLGTMFSSDPNAVNPNPNNWDGNVTMTFDVGLPPRLNFTSPTPVNASTINLSSVEINVTILEDNLERFIFNWNGTNFSFYDSSLILALNFNNNSAIGENETLAVDSSRYGNNLSSAAGVDWNSTAKYGGRSVHFDGTAGLSRDPLNGLMQGNTSITTMSWFYSDFDDLGHPGIGVIGVGDTAQQTHFFQRIASQFLGQEDGGCPTVSAGANKIKFVISADPDDVTDRWYCSISNLSGATWYHGVTTYDASSKEVKMYINGVLDRTISLTQPLNLSAKLWVGTDGYGTPYSGNIDEARVYARTLSESEIFMHYQSEMARYNSTIFNFYNNVTNLSEGLYTAQAFANDTFGNANSTEMRTFDVQAPVLACGTLSSENTTYILTQNLTSSGTCFNVTADNVILECSGYSISIGGVGNSGVDIFGRSNVTIRGCEIDSFNGPGIRVYSSRDIVLSNNTIEDSFNGITLESSENSTVTSNIIRGIGNVAISLSSSNRNNLTFNNASGTNSAVSLASSLGNRVEDNNLTSAGGNGDNGNGIALSGSSSNNVFSYNRIFGAISLGNANNNNFTLNNASGGQQGIIITASTGNLFESNRVKGIVSDIFFNSASGNIFNNIVLFGNSSYVLSSSGSSENNLTDATMLATNGSVTFLGTMTVPDGADVSSSMLNISFNRIFLNSTNLSFMNTSAEITLNELNFTNPQIIVDFQDDGTFQTCSAPQCSNLSYSGGTFVFNVSGFTTYSVQEFVEEFNPNITVCEDLTGENATYVLQNNVNSSGTCFNVRANNVTLDCAGFQINYSQSSSGYGVNSTGYNLTAVKNCDIAQGSTSINSYGINFNRASNGTIFNNSVKTFGSSSFAVHIQSNSDYNTITSNLINATNAGGDGSLRMASSNSNLIQGNEIFTDSGNGLKFDAGTFNLAFGNNITGSGTGVDFAGGASSNNVTSNNISGGNVGLYFNPGTNNNIIFNNSIRAVNTGVAFQTNSNTLISNTITSSAGDGVHFFPGSSNILTGNVIRAITNAVVMANGDNNLFFGNNITARDRYILTDSASTGNNITNTTFFQTNGSVFFPEELIVPADTDASTFVFNISNNRTHLNSSALGFLNTSAILTMHDLSASVPQIIVDYQDDGTFEVCNSPQCNNLSYSGGTFVFNVSSFTTYAVQETSTSLACGTLSSANTVYNLTQSVSSSGTCFTMGADNITLNCAGFSIIGDGSGNGVEITSFSNATINNCTISNFSRGINLNNVSNSNILNNNITTTGSGNTAVSLTSVSNTSATGNIINSQSNGFDIHSSPNSSISIISNIINNFGNRSYAPGIAISDNSSGVNIIGNTLNITAVNTWAGGIIASSGDSNGIISNNSIFLSNITQNDSAYWIMGMWIQSSSINLTISNNLVSITDTNITNPFAGIQLDNGLDSTISNNILIGAGIGISSASGVNVTENNVQITADSISAMSLSGGQNNKISGNNLSSRGISSYALTVDSASGNNEISYNNISHIASDDSTPIVISSGQNNIITDNRLFGFADNANSAGVSVFSANNTLERNYIETNGVGFFISGASTTNNTINNNDLPVNCSSGIAIFIAGSAYQNIITNNRIDTDSPDSFCQGIRLQGNSHDNLIADNNITTSGLIPGGGSIGLRLANTHNNTFLRNSVLTESTAGDAIRLTTGSSNNTFDGNLFTVLDSSNSYGLNLLASSRNFFTNNSFESANYLASDGTSTDNNLTNNIFVSNYGSLLHTHTITIPINANVTAERLNISFNSTYLNSSDSAASFLNTSAVLTLHNLDFTSPQAIVALDDSTFSFCTDCNNISYNGSTFVFNVTHFTTYAVREFVAPDTSSPSVIIHSPANTTYNNRTQLVNLTVTDNAAVDTIIITDGNGNLTYTSPVNVEFNEGSNTLTVIANDTSGNVNMTEFVVFVTDTILPTINFTAPTELNGSILIRDTLSVNVTASDANLVNITIRLFNSTGLVNSSTSITSSYFLNFTGLPAGNYTFNSTAVDIVGNRNDTETRRVEIIADVTPPLILIVSPANQTYNNRMQLVNLTNSSDAVYIWFFNGTANITYTGPINVLFSEGSNTLFAYANDSSGNVNQTSVVFATDTIAPLITIQSPENKTYGSSLIGLNVSANTPISSFFYSLNGAANVSFNPNTTITGNAGSNTIIVYGNDSVGNVNSSRVSFSVNTASPIIFLSSPSNNLVRTNTNNNITFAYNVTNGALVDNCSIMIDGSINQTDTSVTQNIEQSFNVNGSNIGIHTWAITCTNELSQTGYSVNRTFSIIQINSTEFGGDTTNLNNVSDLSNIINFTIHNPAFGKITYTSSVNFSVSISLDQLVNISYNRIEVDSSALSALNGSARIVIYNLNFTDPQVLVDGVECSSPRCVEISFVGGNFTFDVTHFTVYSAGETPVTAPGSGGGGGGRTFAPFAEENATAPTTTPTPAPQICSTKWQCGDWSACTNGTQERECKDANACGTTSGKPSEEQNCISLPLGAPSAADLGIIMISLVAAIAAIAIVIGTITTASFRKNKARAVEKVLNKSYYSLGKGNVSEAVTHYKSMRETFMANKTHMSTKDAKKLYDDGIKLYGEIIKKAHA